jgi:hypothetical protein
MVCELYLNKKIKRRENMENKFDCILISWSKMAQVEKCHEIGYNQS